MDSIVRVLDIENEGNTREVEQFHLTSWPDKGVPSRGYDLIDFLMKTKKSNENRTTPILVHCSAGVGRTGTLVALDYLLQEMNSSPTVDIHQCVTTLRHQRVNMVQTLEQYILIYNILLEYYSCGETTIACHNLSNTLSDLKVTDPKTQTSKLQQQYKLLEEVIQVDLDCSQALSDENKARNRNCEIVPANIHRLWLLTDAEYMNLGHDYINAVLINGYRRTDGFIATQSPLPETVTHFWFLVENFLLTTIVMLNDPGTDEGTPHYWPQDIKKSIECGPFEIQLVSTENHSNIVTRELSIRHIKKDVSRTLKQFHITQWEDNIDKLKDTFIELDRMVRTWRRQTGNKPILVHCSDGASRTGLYCVAAAMFEQMDTEQEVNILQIVKAARLTRPQFIDSMEQYEFCYNLAKSYTEYFYTYANFK